MLWLKTLTSVLAFNILQMNRPLARRITNNIIMEMMRATLPKGQTLSILYYVDSDVSALCRKLGKVESFSNPHHSAVTGILKLSLQFRRREVSSLRLALKFSQAKIDLKIKINLLLSTFRQNIDDNQLITHRKNCECCPGHFLIVNRYSSMSWFKLRDLSVMVT